MSAPMTTGTAPKLLWPGIHATFGVSYDEYGQEWRELFDVETSSKNFEEDVELTGFGLMPVKSQGGGISYDSATQGFVKRYVHVVYGMGYIVTREMIEDNQYGEKATRYAQSLGFSARQTKETVLANQYNRGFNSSYTGGDGKEWFATDHPTIGGTYSNELNPAADLSEAALEDLFIQIQGAVNARGLKIKVLPRKLIIPAALQFEAARILKSVQQPGTANNDINAIRSMNLLPDGVVVNHYLTDADAFYVRTNVDHGPLVFQRRGLEFARDNDFDTENQKAKCSERYSAGWTDPRGVFASAGA